MSEPLQLDPATTAIVLIEYQNEFVSDGGALHDAVAPVMEKTACWPTRSRWSTPPARPA